MNTLEQIAEEKAKLQERITKLNAELETAGIRLTELETAERVLARFSGQTRAAPSALALQANGENGSARPRRRGRPRRNADTQPSSLNKEPDSPSVSDRVLAVVNYAPDETGITKQAVIQAISNARPNVVGRAIQRHLQAHRLVERDGALHACF